VYRKLYHHINEGGIKLFYAETIIENIGGKLDVNTDNKSNIAFTIELPLENEQLF
jgi:sensor histidine kinase regulating citrate/malate metabolism